MLDCRWLAFWGVGRVSRLLLQGLAENPPPGRWVLWGGPEVERLAWPGAEVVAFAGEPRALFGQRWLLEVPRARLSAYLHHQRPLRPGPAVTVVYDTIALRYGGNPAERRARRSYLRAVATLSRRVVTISEYSAACLRRDLGLRPGKVTVISLPIDRDAAARVAERRRASSPGDFALFVGRFAPHKNLDRLIPAFERTELCAGGGRLVLVGGTAEEVQRVSAALTPSQRRFVEVRGWSDADELESLMAGARFLVQPSLEEGFGLTVLEAVAGGLPVCVSDGGSLPEITRGAIDLFPATSIEAMTAAMDRTASSPGDTAALADELLRHVPTVAEYTRRFLRVIVDNLPQ